MTISNTIADTSVNTKRQAELDIARGLSVLFMVLIHTLQYSTQPSVEQSSMGTIIYFLGGVPAAPVFMFLLGVGIVYSKRADPTYLIKRGSIILLLGYVLNAMRDSMPALLFGWMNNDSELFASSVYYFFSVDILQFAGLALIFFGLVKKFTFNNYVVLFLGLYFSLVNLFLLQIQVDNFLLFLLTGLFWGSHQLSEFPFLTWIFYPIAGYFFGQLLIHCLDKTKCYTIVFFVALVILLISTFVFSEILELNIFDNTRYFHHTLAENIIYTAFVLCWLCILAFSSSYIPAIISKIITRWSQNVLEIYIIHWILIGWTTYFIYHLSVIEYIIYAIVIMIISDSLAYVYRQQLNC